MLACSAVQARLSESLDGEIDGWYGKYVSYHSHICIKCSRMRRSLERTQSLLRQLRDVPPKVDAAPSNDPSD